MQSGLGTTPPKKHETARARRQVWDGSAERSAAGVWLREAVAGLRETLQERWGVDLVVRAGERSGTDGSS